MPARSRPTSSPGLPQPASEALTESKAWAHAGALLEDAVGKSLVVLDRGSGGGHQPALDVVGVEAGLGLEQQGDDAPRPPPPTARYRDM